MGARSAVNGFLVAINRYRLSRLATKLKCKPYIVRKYHGENGLKHTVLAQKQEKFQFSSRSKFGFFAIFLNIDAGFSSFMATLSFPVLSLNKIFHIVDCYILGRAENVSLGQTLCSKKMIVSGMLEVATAG